MFYFININIKYIFLKGNKDFVNRQSFHFYKTKTGAGPRPLMFYLKYKFGDKFQCFFKENKTFVDLFVGKSLARQILPGRVLARQSSCPAEFLPGRVLARPSLPVSTFPGLLPGITCPILTELSVVVSILRKVLARQSSCPAEFLPGRVYPSVLCPDFCPELLAQY
jgi:hypothetical protein